jgi:hypothetical protein
MLKNRDFTENRTEPVHLSASNYRRTGYLVSAFLKRGCPKRFSLESAGTMSLQTEL